MKFKLTNEHDCFSGHFPLEPIAPGVYLINKVVDYIAKELNQQIFVKHIITVRYPLPLRPEIEATLEYHIESDQSDTLFLKAQLFNVDGYFMQLKARILVSHQVAAH